MSTPTVQLSLMYYDGKATYSTGRELLSGDDVCYEKLLGLVSTATWPIGIMARELARQMMEDANVSEDS